MQETPNLKLKKPDLTDYVKVSDLNENADVIDAEITTNKDNLATHWADKATHTSYASCSTAASTTAKVATSVGFGLVVGSRITVKFTSTNTAAAPTLNINGTGAKAIFLNDTQVGNGGWEAGAVLEFVYDGARYNVITDSGIGKLSNLNTAAKTNIVSAMNELFTNANNGKTDIASVVGSPATAGNTFAQLKTHIQDAKNKGAANLTAKGTSTNGTESLDSLMTKIASVSTGKKWASGVSSRITLNEVIEYKTYSANNNAGSVDSSFSASSGLTGISVTGLDFKPSFIRLFYGDNIGIIYEREGELHATLNRYYNYITNGTGSIRGEGFVLKTSLGRLFDGGFNSPLYGSVPLSITWEAYE